METLDELDRLVAEQKQDDTDTIKREFHGQVPFTNGIANCIGMDTDGEIVTFFARPPKGTLLVGTAAWHGTRNGYTNHKCRCEPCTEANTDYFQARRQNGGS